MMLALIALLIATISMIHNYMLEGVLFNTTQVMHHEALVIALIAFAIGRLPRFRGCTSFSRENDVRGSVQLVLCVVCRVTCAIVTLLVALNVAYNMLVYSMPVAYFTLDVVNEYIVEVPLFITASIYVLWEVVCKAWRSTSR